VTLTEKAAGDAAIELKAQLRQVRAEDFCLAKTGGRQDVVIVCTKGGLAMSYQIDAAHVRVFPAR
jgi:phage shock protein PspC (stress-responsive transcriptional regulator)